MQKFSLSLIILFSLVINVFAQEVPENWYHLDPTTDNYNGVSEIRSYKELLKGKKSTTVIVAVIDSGIDIEHEDLKSVMWTNKGEIAGNGIDDDKNGYKDDVHGWNFIGGSDGRNINGETLEITRLYMKYKKIYANVDPSKLSKKKKKEYDQYLELKKTVEEEYSKAKNQLEGMKSTETTLMGFVDLLEKEIDGDALSLEAMESVKSEDPEYMQASQVAQRFIEQWGDNIKFSALRTEIKNAFIEGINYFEGKVKYNYNASYNGRADIVKDDQNNDKEKYYGNNDAEGPDALHGTHVGGIIGAQRGNSIGMDGIAANVEVMSVRAVPNGDERDKDVANAIRYAVDNGAKVINMSFGKSHSWNKRIVDKAVRYAEKHDVLLVHAAGNSSQNNDLSNNYPNDKYEKIGFWFWKKKRAKNWIEIGALSYEKGKDLVAGFSNYGQTSVDVFAPGMKIYSTIPDDKYKNLQGTSMASPVVAGMAAVLRSYFPSLSAVEVKEILMDSSIKLDEEVNIPGKEGETTNFSKLSITGGVVNLYTAIKLAEQRVK